jgi:hypothetical protein
VSDEAGIGKTAIADAFILKPEDLLTRGATIPTACQGYLKFLRQSNLAGSRSSAIVASC